MTNINNIDDVVVENTLSESEVDLVDENWNTGL